MYGQSGQGQVRVHLNEGPREKNLVSEYHSTLPEPWPPPAAYRHPELLNAVHLVDHRGFNKMPSLKKFQVQMFSATMI